MSPAPAVQKLPLRSLACKRCGTAFQCGSAGADGSCWCMDESYRLPMPDPAAGDCLCPACLRREASEARERTA
ncbi:MAG: cysteine-rich CWC family protein [Xanthobacteraceae bacterium]|nr:cysteine-rich CWC family protein [Xanthobacteraceae bacterium]